MTNEELKEKTKPIELLICDVDGVLSNGTILIGHPQSEIKAFHCHDGLGLKLLKQAGLNVAIITSRQSPVVEYRMAELGIDLVFQGQKNKQAAFQSLLGDLNLAPSQVAYIGDDLPDLPIMQQVGFSVAVANATPFVREHADYVTYLKGGEGAVREVCELILHSQKRLQPLLDTYIN